MGFLDLIEEHNGVRLASYGLCQLSALIVAYIARRGTNQTGNTVFLLILRHVDTCHHRLIVKQIICQGLGEFRLTDTCGAEEDKRGDRSLGILETGT